MSNSSYWSNEFSIEERNESYSLAILLLSGFFVQSSLLIILFYSSTRRAADDSFNYKGHKLALYLGFLSAMASCSISTYVPLLNALKSSWVISDDLCASLGCSVMFFYSFSLFLVVVSSTERYVSILRANSLYAEAENPERGAQGRSQLLKQMEKLLETIGIGGIQMYWIVLIGISLAFSLLLTFIPLVVLPGENRNRFYGRNHKLVCSVKFYNSQDPVALAMSLFVIFFIGSALTIIFAMNFVISQKLKQFTSRKGKPNSTAILASRSDMRHSSNQLEGKTGGAAKNKNYLTDLDMKIYSRIFATAIILAIQWGPYSLVILMQLIYSRPFNYGLELSGVFLVYSGYFLLGVAQFLSDRNWRKRISTLLGR